MSDLGLMTALKLTRRAPELDGATPRRHCESIAPQGIN